MKEGAPIQINEVFRDGIQAVPEYVPLEIKLDYIDKVRQAIKPGAKCVIEVTSFVHPKVIPQHADAAQVISALTPEENAIYSVLIPNQRGFDNAIAADAGRGVIGEIAGFTAATDAFLMHNMNTTPEASLEELARLHAASEAAGIPFVAYVSCMAVCPYEGLVTPETLRIRVDQLRQKGIRMIKLGATTGKEDPAAIARAIEEVQKNDLQYPGVMLGGHAHHTNGNGIVNSLEFVKRGITSLDGSAAGVGVTRYAGEGIAVTDVSLANNSPSDELAATLAGMGYEVGWDEVKLAQAGIWLARQIKLPIHSEFASQIG